MGTTTHRAGNCCAVIWYQKLKGIGSDLGGAIKGFKKAVSEEDADFKEPQSKVEEKPTAGSESVKTESETKEKH